MAKGIQSSGVRKKNNERNMPRRGKATGNAAHADFLKIQPRDRHPGQAERDKAFEMLKDRPTSGPVKKSPSPLPMPLLESLAFHTNPNTVKATARLLIAACLKVKNTRRHPGWVLQRTYNMKNRVVEIV